MASKKRQVQLLTAEEVKQLGPRIDEMLDAGSYLFSSKDTLAVYGSHSLFAGWAASAAQCGDTSQLGMIVGWLQTLDWENEFGSVATQAALKLAGNDPGLRAQVHPLAGTGAYSIVHPLIGWLDPNCPAEQKLLDKLCRSRSRYIAKAARERLASSETVPWWQSYFEHDPSAGLDEAAMSDLQPTFARYMELLDADDKENANEIFTLVQQLPPRAKAGACLRLLRQWGWYGELLGPVTGELLSVEGGVRMLFDLVKKEHGGYHVDVCDGLRKLPPTTTSEQRVGVALEALSRLAGATEKELDDVRGLASTYARMVALSWPGDHDPTPVLDFLVETADPDAEKPSYAVGHWSSLVKRLEPRWLPLLKERFEEALAGDFVGRFSILGPSLEDVSDRFPEAECRRMALEVLGRPNAKHSVEWAVRTLSPDRFPRNPEPSRRPEGASACVLSRFRRDLRSRPARDA